MDEWRSQLCHNLEDKKGWDALFFFGHSEENETTGGKLGISANASIFVEDIKSYLQTAKEKGLQFALFNSCSGIDIAKYLIGEIGLSQVIIMSEPIHNKVAQSFFKLFLDGLKIEANVVQVLQYVCRELKNNLNYPSASLIPLVFAYPNASFFRLQPHNHWKTKLKPWLLSTNQLAVFSLLAILAVFSPAQKFLLEIRIVTQALYREITGQIADEQEKPPVVLISIDDESFNREKIESRYPINRKYLAKIIDRLAQSNAKIIGVDYLLDRPQSVNDTILSKSIDNSIKENDTLFAFASIEQNGNKIGINPEIADLKTVTQASIYGAIDGAYEYVEIPNDCYKSCPLGYFLALNYLLNKNNTDNINFDKQKDYTEQILDRFYQSNNDDEQYQFLQQINKSTNAKTSFFWRTRIFKPIIDYSIPPDRVYQTVPAWELLTEENQQSFSNSIVLIASGGYEEAGINGQEDYKTAPLAVRFWSENKNVSSEIFTGGQVHAYVTQHWLNQHFVITIPDFCLMLIAIFLSKLIEQQILSTLDNKKRITIKSFQIEINIFLQLLAVINIIYIIVSLQFYVSLKILFPFLLPSLSFWFYLLFSLTEYSNEKS